MVNGLQAALKLARGRADAIAMFAATPADESIALAARSFWAIAPAVPALLALHLIAWIQSGVPADATQDLTDDLGNLVVSWLGFAVLSHSLARRIGRSAFWPRFITLWNWCNVVQYLMLVGSAILALLGLPGWISQTAWLVALGWALWLEWFAARLALDISAATAMGFVALDLGLGLILSALTG